MTSRHVHATLLEHVLVEGAESESNWIHGVVSTFSTIHRILAAQFQCAARILALPGAFIDENYL